MRRLGGPAGVLAALSACLIGLTLLAADGARRPMERLGVLTGPPEIVYIPAAEAKQLQLLREQQLIWTPEGQTDMWIKIAEAIDHDAGGRMPADDILYLP